MSKKINQIIVILLISIVLSASSSQPRIDKSEVGGTRAYCVATASNPVKSGNYVKGTGNVSCTSTTGWIRVVVQVRDYGSTSAPPIERTATAEKTCYNVTSCTVSAYLYLPGYTYHYYDTAVSGYYPNNSTYDQSSKVLIY